MTGMSDSLHQAVEKMKMVVPFPIEHEPRIDTMSRPVVIESACPGWQPAERYAAVPVSIEAQVQEITDSVRAGAVAVHVHPRNPKDGNNYLSVPLLVEVMKGVFDNLGDCVTLQHTWTVDTEKRIVDYITHTDEILQIAGGNKYCQGSVVLATRRQGFAAGGFVFDEEATWNGVKWLEAHDVKPVYQLFDTYVHVDLLEHGIKSGVSTGRPYLLNVHLGKHHSHAIHTDPWSYLQLIANYNMVKAAIPDSIIGVYPGGRNWLPILTLGLLLGAPLVRVGIEECYWIWPHRDEIIQKNSDMVKLAVELCNILGRRVVTDPVEARQLLGLKLTSSVPSGV